MRLDRLSFEDWVAHCFAHDVADPQWHFALEADTWEGSAELTIEHLTRLFMAPASVLSVYTDGQINQGLWYIVHNACSDHMYALVDESVPIASRVRCVRSIESLYSELFAVRCSNALSHGSHSSPEMSPLNSACYMFWDLMPLVPAPGVPEREQLDRSILHVLDAALQLPSVACQESALHGLGHWAVDYPTEARTSIERFLSRGAVGQELREYAECAGQGNVL